MEHIISVLVHAVKWLYPLFALLSFIPQTSLAGMLSGLPAQPEFIQLVNSLLLAVLGVIMGWLDTLLSARPSPKLQGARGEGRDGNG
ncbi:MAG TPA: hypothetical protein DCR93_30580 [Cytophagales bacterium]|nr:hypothetical protein [Cytophagales bacterium]